MRLFSALTALILGVATTSTAQASILFQFSNNAADYGFTLGSAFGSDGLGPESKIDFGISLDPSILGTSFSLTNPSDFLEFKLGTMTLTEAAITAPEVINAINNGSLIAKLGLIAPEVAAITLNGSGTAAVGNLNGTGNRFFTNFGARSVSFNSGNDQYTVSLNPNQFSTSGTQDLTVRVTLDTNSLAGTPEPGTLVLTAAGGLAFAFRRLRRRNSAKSAEQSA